MPPKAKTPAPIDRPLSRAYLREFTGWSTAFPPGLSEPTSLRTMENMQINRDGSLRVRPGLRYLSYAIPPVVEPEAPLPDPDVLASAHMAAPFAGRSGGVDTTFPNPESDLSDNDPATGITLDTYLPPPEVFANGLSCYMRNTGYEVDLTGAEHYIRVDWEADPGVFITEVRFWVAGSGQAGIWDGSPPIETNIGWLYRLDSGTVLNSLTTTNTDVSGVEGQVWVSHPDGATEHHMVTIREFEVIAIRAGSLTVSPPEPGVAYDLPLVGTHEPFYLSDGTKAYLLAVREIDQTVGFRVLVSDTNESTMYALDDPYIDFDVRQPAEVLNFTADTTYVKYLQIDNKIFALSDNGEPMRVFKVGTHKEAKALAAISRPSWDSGDKLKVVHPDAAWITSRELVATRRNRLANPSFETNGRGWSRGAKTRTSRPSTSPLASISGTRTLRLESEPERTNLALQPLHDVATTGVVGWSGGVGDVSMSVNGTWAEATLGPSKRLHLAHSRALPGIKGGEKYKLAFDWEKGNHVDVKARLRFYGVNGAVLGTTTLDVGASRWASSGVIAPKGAVSARIYIGGENTQQSSTYVRFKNVVLALASEATSAFSGGSGADYFWTGTANASASVYHPPATVQITSARGVARPGKALVGSVYVGTDGAARNVTLRVRTFNKDGQLKDDLTTTAADTVGSLGRIETGVAAIHAKAVRAEVRITIPSVPRGEYHYVDAAMLETGAATAGSYFDGSTTDTGIYDHRWSGTAHASASIRREYAAAPLIPDPETRTPDTLVATGGKTANPYQFGFFYTFNNEVGESAASRVTIRRASRAWSEWLWETANAAGEPSGTTTDDPELCADQLVAYMPEDVFNEAMAEGAVSWSLYMFTWSDQDPVPVVALKVAERDLPADAVYAEKGWLRVTPQQSGITEDALLPSEGNRENYSEPSGAGQGLVAADRMILVNDPAAAGVIRWSSNLTGEYTNFTAAKGGGYKTLTTGNLYVPAAVLLWQNPQSVDTLTILCLGTDGKSAAYYMAPGQVTSQTDATSFMGFEETTATQGTTSPYGVEVLNNALYHPLDDMLVKSTASNYNISHKSMTDLIENMWVDLADKYWIMSSQLDNRLFLLVHNPSGDPLEDACKGNEVWVFDTAKDSGTWSRFKIQGHALRKIEFGHRIYMSVVRPDGVYYLDPEYSRDDYVDPSTLQVLSRAIPWKFETNTQGANRAHDAWAHLQQVSLVLGNFQGSAKFGIRSYDVNGRALDISKITQDYLAPTEDGLPWDVTDHLLVRRDVMEWSLYGESLPDVESAGQVNLVQYRYTPVSVNVGYEYGSVETFEYARNVASGNDAISTNGVPVPAIDTRRP